MSTVHLNVRKGYTISYRDVCYAYCIPYGVVTGHGMQCPE